MKRRLITVILFSLVAALASSTILYRVLAAKPAPPSGGATRVYVAARDLSAGAILADADLKVVNLPGPVGSRLVVRREDLVGRGLSAAVNSGEPFPDNRLTPRGSPSGFAARIPNGMRVVSVHQDDAAVLSRLSTPGMRVDVLSTGARGGMGGPDVTTRTILQNVKVVPPELDSDARSQPKSAAASSVDLLVSPEQAEVLTQAIAQTKIQLVLRNPLDNSTVSEARAAAARPAGTQVAPHVTPGVEKVRELPIVQQALPTIEIVQGGKRTYTTISAGFNPGQEN